MSASVKPGDRILIHGKTPAIIVLVRDETPPSAEAVYRNSSGKIVAEDVELHDVEWRFKNFGSCGATYADRHDRFAPYISLLISAESR